MGLFSKRKSDDGRPAEATPQAQVIERPEEEPPSERPTERMSTESSAPERGRPGPEAGAGEAASAELTPPEPDSSEPVITRGDPGPEHEGAWKADGAPTAAAEEGRKSSDRVPDEDDTGSIEKDELRRAVSGSKPKAETAGKPRRTGQPEEADEARVSAQDLIAPTPQRKHPFQPEPVEERGERQMQVYVFANQKGGVAKTTTTLNLAVAFAESGHRVLLVDLDPQGNLTMSQGIDPDDVEKSMYDVLVDRMPISEIVQRSEVDIAVSSIDLAGAEIAMSTQIGRERSLQKALKEVEGDYDFVCIDTPPSLGLLTINALTAADRVIVPVQCEYLSMRGLVQLQNTLEMIRENLNPDVQIEGILPTMLDSRTVHAKEAVEILEENFGDLVFKSRIKKAIKFAEAPVKGSSVLKYDSGSNAAKYYRDLAEEVLTHGQAT